MLGLVLKDIFVIWKQLFAVVVFCMIGGISIDILFLSLSFFVCAALPTTAIAYDVNSKWNELSAMMPFSKIDLVLSKYVLGYLFLMMVFMMLVIIGVEVTLIFPIFIGALVYLAINLPVTFKFGPEKGRLVFFFIVAIISGLFGAMGNEMNTLIEMFNNVSVFYILIIVTILNLLSIKLATKLI